jgi:hypothetical protein
MAEIKTTEEYFALSRSERGQAYSTLSNEMKKIVRKESERRRGIAFRTQDGDIIFSRATLKEQILRINEKKNSLAQREVELKGRIVELKKQAQEVYGDEFVVEIETALDAQ